MNKIPPYITLWINNFLNNRSFKVKINESLSPKFPIKAGVPQGSVLSPLLFSLFINDIPKKDQINQSYSLLFADDLTTFFIFKKTGHLNAQINKYLKEVEKWLIKLKMKMSAEKCNFIIFNKKSSSDPCLNLNLFGKTIPKSDKLKFLGVTLDERLSFKNQIDEIKTKCNPRLNLIKILSNKRWGLSKVTLSSIYKALIGSIIDYYFPLVNILSNDLLKKLQVIQNTAIRSILKLPYFTNSENLFHQGEQHLKLQKVDHRLQELTERYIRNGLDKSVQIVVRLVNEFKNSFESRHINYSTPLCNCYLIISEYFSI